MNIYLTGFMGTGKSAVGAALARRLGRELFDTDAWVERRARRSVARLWAEKGEAAFRRLERRAVAAAAGRRDAVVALGGGALLDARSARTVGDGLLIALTCRRDELWRRLRKTCASRPLIKGGKSSVFSLLRRRRSSYARADFSVSTTGRTPEATAARIARRLAS